MGHAYAFSSSDEVKKMYSYSRRGNFQSQSSKGTYSTSRVVKIPDNGTMICRATVTVYKGAKTAPKS